VHLNMFYMLKNGMMLYTALIWNIINYFNILIFRRTTAEQHVNNLYSVQPLFCGLVYGIYALNLFQIEALPGQKKFLTYHKVAYIIYIIIRPCTEGKV
jgi:hypothetical protein